MIFLTVNFKDTQFHI